MLSRVAHDVCHAQPVIIVHNDPVARELALTALRSAGHEAAALADPMAALDAVEANPSTRVLITRVNFGTCKLNGVALARMVKLKQPSIQVVFVALPQQRIYMGDAAFLPTPLDARSRLLASS